MQETSKWMVFPCLLVEDLLSIGGAVNSSINCATLLDKN